MEATTEWKMGEGGGTYPSPTALGLGISAPPPSPNFQVLFGTGRGAKVFYPPQPDYRKLIIFPSFTNSGHTHSTVCAPRPPFLSAELWVICYHLGNLGCMTNRYYVFSQLCITVYTGNII